MRKADRFVRQMVALASAAALMLCQVPAVAAVSATAGEAPTSAGNTELTSGTAAEATVVSECVDLREESVKHFLLSDGTVRAVQYDVPVHYWENGTWVDYDNRLTSSNTRLGTRQWTTACSDAGVTFPETLGSDDITLEKDGYAIGWRYVGSQNSTGTVSCATASEAPTVLTRLSSTVRYTDVFF